MTWCNTQCLNEALKRLKDFQARYPGLESLLEPLEYFLNICLRDLMKEHYWEKIQEKSEAKYKPLQWNPNFIEVSEREKRSSSWVSWTLFAYDIRQINLVCALENQPASFYRYLSHVNVWIPSSYLSGISLDNQKIDLLITWSADEIQFSVNWLLWAAYANQALLVDLLLSQYGISHGCCVFTQIVQSFHDAQHDLPLVKPCCILGEWTPLMLACIHDSAAAAVVLLKAGASVEARDSNGYTALGHAALCGALQCVVLLLRYQASLYNLDGRNSSLADLAEQMQRWDLYQLFVYATSIKAAPQHITNQSIHLHSSLGVRQRQLLSSNNTTKIVTTPASLNLFRFKEFPSWSHIFFFSIPRFKNFFKVHEWEVIVLPVITLFSFSLITFSFFTEIFFIIHNTHWRFILPLYYGIQRIGFPLVWILLYFLFRFPNYPSNANSSNSFIECTDIQLIQDILNDPKNLPFLSPLEMSWHNQSNVDFLGNKKKFLVHYCDLQNKIDISRMCFSCFSFKQLRTFHCRYCRQCIARFDHHCFWLGRCIGRTNHRYFMIFVLLLCIIQNFHFLFSLLCFFFYVRYESVRAMMQFPKLTVVSFAIHVLSIYWTNKLLYTQMFNIAYNMTTYERLRGEKYMHFWKISSHYETGRKDIVHVLHWRNPFNQGVKKNCIEFWSHTPRDAIQPSVRMEWPPYFIGRSVFEHHMQTTTFRRKKFCGIDLSYYFKTSFQT